MLDPSDDLLCADTIDRRSITTVTERRAASTESSEEDEHSEDYPQTNQALCEQAAAHASDVAADTFPSCR